jgi:hypothetical protein
LQKIDPLAQRVPAPAPLNGQPRLVDSRLRAINSLMGRLNKQQISEDPDAGKP